MNQLGDPPSAPDAGVPPKWPAMDVIYEEVKGRIAAQDAHSGILDTKANFGLASATLLTAGAIGLGKTLSEAEKALAAQQAAAGLPASGPTEVLFTVGGSSVSAADVVVAVTFLALAAYVAVVVCSFCAYRLRTWDVSPAPEGLVKNYLHETAEDTKAALTSKRVEDYTKNKADIAGKVKWTNWALGALLAEAALLLVIAVVQVALY